MKKEMRKCAVCGKKFTPKSANAAYCSDKCYKAAKSKRDKANKAAKKSAKATTEKPVKLTEKVALPKKPTEKVTVKVIKPSIHLVKPNDIIRFSKEFSPERVFDYATRLAGLAWLQLIAKSAKKDK